MPSVHAIAALSGASSDSRRVACSPSRAGSTRRRASTSPLRLCLESQETTRTCDCVVVGDGDQLEPLTALAGELGVTDKALFVGGHPPERVAEYFAASDVFLFPTRRHEAGPIVLLEGMSCGLPTIASRIGGNTEVVEPAGLPVAGVLTRPGDLDELEAAIRRVLADGELARSLGERARQRILEEYTVELMIERTVAVYRLAIERGEESWRMREVAAEA